MPPEWTLDDLVARVGDALGAVDYPGAPNGRVRDLPDRRAVRYYTTIGLLDRPAAMRGRTALYSARHLAQLVAIKRRQAQGRTLTEIQAELVGATDARLAQIAGLPPSAPAAPAVDAGAARDTVTFRPRAAFWTDRPAPVAPFGPGDRGGPEAPGRVLAGVPLAAGVVLLLPGAPTPDDLAALRDAARPLVDLLIARGLVPEDRSAP